MENITLPSGLSVIGEGAFYYCTALSEIVLPEALTSVEANLFYGCTNLMVVTLPSKLTAIGDSAFCNCTKLKEITIPVTVRTIGENEFSRNSMGNALKATVLTRDAEISPTAFSYHPSSVIYGYAHSAAQTVAYLNGIMFIDLETGEALYSSSNRNWQDYSKYGTVIQSYLYADSSGNLVRVECLEDTNKVFCEVDSTDYRKLSHLELEPELSLFGGFYCGKDYNFLIFGQINPTESDDVEVVRVVRYTKDWERVDAASIYGANTSASFRAGSLRAEEYDGTLYVLTCHSMYRASDGKQHQSSFSFRIRISDMTVTDISNMHSYDYVSHSFNQFTHIDDGAILTVQHGDGYPRAVLLSRDMERISILSFYGGIGKNDTGASVGGFECSSDSYLVAGNSILQDGTISFDGQRNIFLSVTKKTDFTTSGTSFKWITSFENKSEVEVQVSTPHLVKYSDDCFLLMWTEDNVLRYYFLDGSGNRITDIYSDETAKISDCKPIVKDNTIIWYVTEHGAPTIFYEIDPSNPSVIHAFHKHVYENGDVLPTCTSAAHVVYTCLFCDDSYEVDESALGHIPGNAAQENFVEAACTTGAGYDLVTRCQRCSEILTLEHVETAPPFGHDYGPWQTRTAPTCTEPGEDYRTCSRCDAEDTRTVDALGHKAGQPKKENIVSPTCTESGGYDMVIRCQRCNEILESEHFATDPLGHDYGPWQTRTAPTCTEPGEDYRTCSRCDAEDTRTVDALGHNPGRPVKENNKEATCTEAGEYDLVTRCQRCNEILESTHFTTNALGHDFSAWQTRQALTCTQAGMEFRVCSRCHKEETRTEEAPGHDWDEGVVTVEPSAEGEGVRTYTCRRCGETRTEAISNNPFVDVKKSKYYYKPVLWAYYHNPQITNGTDATHFSPNDTCTRAQVVTFLWAAQNKPEADWDNNPFVDVKKSKYYFKPVLWAFQNGVTSGMDATHFQPNGECTRAQVVTFLWAMSGKPAPKDGNNPFKDVKKSSWYYKAVLWANQNGITSGVDATHFGPNQTCTRGQVVTFLYALLGKK